MESHIISVGNWKRSGRIFLYALCQTLIIVNNIVQYNNLLKLKQQQEKKEKIKNVIIATMFSVTIVAIVFKFVRLK
jgi:hypothetical protein